MAWYADAIKQFPEGLVTQAQAARMLGISRMAVNRLVGRQYLRAVYFPREPEVLEIPIGHDDPTWLKILGWLGKSIGDKDWVFPTACYVSFADVLKVWRDGNIQKKCKTDWSIVLKYSAAGHSPQGRRTIAADIVARRAEEGRKREEERERGKGGETK